jgi:hypothetical protein
VGSRVSEGTCVPSQARQRGAGLRTWRAVVGEATVGEGLAVLSLLSPTVSYGECRSLGGATGALGSGDRPGGAKRSLEVKSPASLPRARGRPEESLSGQVSVPVEPERCSGRHCAR